MHDGPSHEVAPTGGARLWLAFAFAGLIVHLLVWSGYGYFRDEFYYLACSDHLAWGYVDQPPLSILVLWISRRLLGDSVVAIRLLPAVAHAATLYLSGWMARALGGGRVAQGLAMTAVLIAPLYLALTGFFSMNAFDLLLWTAAGCVLIRIFQTERPRLWILLGVILGLGLMNKISVLWLGFGLFVGLLLTRQRRWLKTPWPWLAGLIAGLIFLPHVLWQVGHGWPTLEFIRNATGTKMRIINPVEFVSGQILTMSPLTVPLWIAGLVFFFFLARGRTYRPLGWIYLTVFVLLLVNQTSRASYLAPAYTLLFAGGGVAFERLFARLRARWLPAAAFVVLILGGAALAPLALPILPVERYIAYARALRVGPSTDERKELGALPQHYADMFGWNELVETLDRVYRALPEEDRERAAIHVFNYGEAGAIDLLGRRYGLPLATSGHNNYWLWGPRGYSGDVVIFVGGRRESYTGAFEQVELAGTTHCEYCMPYENDQAIWVCRGIKRPLEEVWPQLKHYD